MNSPSNTNIFSYKGIFPKISPNVFIAPTASIVGDVEIGSFSGIWFNSVIRGDVEPVKIGSYTNIQDGTVIHVTRGGGKTFIGSYVTIGHSCLLHACKLNDYSFVGMGSIILDGAEVETGAYVAAGSMVTGGKIVKKGEMWAGRPAKFFRLLTEEETAYIEKSALNYAKHIEEYLAIE